jgi:hypothetical protein
MSSEPQQRFIPLSLHSQFVSIRINSNLESGNHRSITQKQTCPTKRNSRSSTLKNKRPIPKPQKKLQKKSSKRPKKEASCNQVRFYPPLENLPLTSTTGSGAFLGSYGNAAGDKIESGLSPVGKPLGKGLETIARPVGGVVDALVGGVMRFGSAHGEIAGVGAGNMDKKKEMADEKMKEPIGGKDQTADNPLGL